MNENRTKKHEYQERYRFWCDKRISQLSFHNNILLTLGFAVAGYFWSERDRVYLELVFDLGADIDWKIVIFISGLITIALSITSGFILSLSRLYDLRLTSNILLTRTSAIDKNVEIKDEPLSAPTFIEVITSLLSVISRYQDYEIRKEEIEETKAFQEKFTDLRQKTRNIGISTWGLVKWQTSSMLVAILLFLLTLLLK